MSAVPCDAPPVLPDGTTAPQGVLHLDKDSEGQQQQQQQTAGTSSSSKQVFYFNQKVCIPSYLIALAVGELESRELSDR